jgi:hypothetical protein
MATAAFKGLQNFEKDNNISKEDFFDNNSVANNFIYEASLFFSLFSSDRDSASSEKVSFVACK